MSKNLSLDQLKYNVLRLVLSHDFLRRQTQVKTAKYAPGRAMTDSNHVALEFVQPCRDPSCHGRPTLATRHDIVPRITPVSRPCVAIKSVDCRPVQSFPNAESDFLDSFLGFDSPGIKLQFVADQPCGFHRAAQGAGNNVP